MTRFGACGRLRRSSVDVRTSPRRFSSFGRLARALVLLSTAGGCCHLPPREPAREPVAADEGLLSALRPRHPAWGLELELIESTASYRRFALRFQTYCDLRGDFKIVEGDYYATRRAGRRRAPLLLISPILAGTVNDYLASRFISWGACKAGMSTYFLHQEMTILDPSRDALELEAWVRENVRDNLKALDLLARLPEVDGSRLGSVGVSLGAIKNVVLVACEKRLRANVLTLAGVDLADMLTKSREKLVMEYVRERMARDGLSAAEVVAEFRRWFRSEPARLAESIESERMLLFLGRLDDKVPYENGLVLRRLLGDPETYVFPLGHYTGMLAAPWVVQVALGWLRERFDAS